MKAPSYTHHLSQMLLQLLDTREQFLVQAQSDNELTLKLLQDIKDGTVDPSQLVITDDGWQLMPPEPSAPSHDANGNSPGATAEVFGGTR